MQNRSLTLILMSMIVFLAGSFASDNKQNASTDGLIEAEKALSIIEKGLEKMGTADLIKSLFISSPQKTYGDFEYYFKYKTNRLIIKELRTRSDDVRRLLPKFKDDKRSIYGAANARRETISSLCRAISNDTE